MTLAGCASEMFEAHYCGLESQSNIYGLCKIELPSRPIEILVASLRGKNGPKVISLRISNTKPVSKEIRFTYVPGDAEIISIDTFNKFHHGNNVVVGITFIKTLDDKPHYYLNIYSERAPTENYDLDSIAQGWYNIELSFIPYQLSHAEYVCDGNVETVFLLSGSDHRVHVFREDKYMQNFTEELCVDKCFPEFENLHASNVTRLETKYFGDYQRRIAALGFLDGWVSVSLVNTKATSVMKTWDIQHDSPITSVNIFTLKTDVECPHFVTEVMDSLEDTVDCCCPDFHVLVTSAVEVAVIYRSVLSKGFTDPLVLQHSDKFDSVLCACMADVDMDGQHEIILGTYGQEMLVYKFECDDTEEDTVVTTSKEIRQEKPFKRTPSSRSIPKNKSSSSLSSADGQENAPKCPVHSVDSGEIVKTETSAEWASVNQHTEVMVDAKESGGKDDVTPSNTESESSKAELNKEEKETETDPVSVTSKSNRKVSVANGNDSGAEGSGQSTNQERPEIGSLSFKDSKQNANIDPENDERQFFENEQTDTLCNGSYVLLWKKSFAEPIFAIDSVDLIGDGLEELVVLTLKGLHVLQHEPQKATALCLERLKLATQQHEAHNNDAFKQLLSESLLCQDDGAT